VNDLERDLQAVLQEDARRVPTPTSAPEGLRRSARRRQTVFGSLVGLSALAIVAGIVAGATMLLPFRSDTQPVGEGPKTTGTLNGIMITYPAAWNLVDPDEAGLNGPGPSTLPRIVLALSPHPASSAIACPGLTDGEPPTFLMTVQEEPLDVDARSVTWPTSLEPMNQGTSGSGCYPDWEFMRAGWTIADRTFEARVGFAPDASDDDRDAVFAAFASMAFAAPPDGITSVMLATGTAGGQEWSLIATREDDGLGLTLQGPSSGAGIGSFDPSPQKLQISSHAFGEGPDRELVLFGAAPPEVVRIEAVEASTADGFFVSADVLDVPNKIDPDLNAFALVVPPGGTFDIRGFDASGNVVISGSVGGGPEGVAEPTPFPGAALGDGRHFGYVRSVDTEARTIEFDLAYFLSGEEANQAYQEATGESGPVPNDHFVVNDNPMLRTLTLAPDARLRLLDWNNCCDSFFDGDLALFAEAIGEQADVTDGDLIYRGQSQWWITVENGVVTEIEEQYSP
jgi:hypothetical protein